ncbi:type II secretion system F family protein [Pseudomonas chlororaphis]|uniref:type II secretion system F family protein n=1 Tax=Pseudomonas chlororaphis TaxID=587753 RepID=UPI002D798A14|nr:type II secretion system F family protein [Pseudomonas chlororaphis]
MISISETWATFVLKYFGGTRIDFYEGFQNLVENGISVNDSLKELNAIWSYSGKKPDAPLAIMTSDLMIQLANGMALSRALSRWVPYEEASLLAAGEKAGSLVQACDDIIRVITAKQQIVGAVVSAVAYPAFLSLPLSTILATVASKLVPSMARASPPETWEGAAWLLYRLSNFVTGYGLLTVALLLAVVTVFVVSLPRWTGSIRGVFDRGPFYSTYRMVHGSTFLMNLAVLMRASIPPYNALEMLGEYANPWLKEKIRGALYGIRMGSNLGVALDDAGHNFPDKRAIQFIRILAARDGFEKAINNYSDRWLKASIKRIQFTAKLSFVVSLLMIGAVMGLVIVGSQEMENNFDKSIGHTATRIPQS